MTKATGSSELVERRWTCFHCGETFTDERCARLHFGRDEGATVACVLKGADGGLLQALRDAEEQADHAIQAMHDESTDVAKAYHSQRCRHTQALMAAEESGYEKGLADARAEAADRITDLEARLARAKAPAPRPDNALADEMIEAARDNPDQRAFTNAQIAAALRAQASALREPGEG